MENRLADVGKDIVKQKLQQIDVEYNDVAVNKLVKYFDMDSAVQLYQTLGEGKLEPSKIKHAFSEKETEEKSAAEIKPVEHSVYQDDISSSDNNLLIIDNLKTIGRMAQNC